MCQPCMSRERKCESSNRGGEKGGGRRVMAGKGGRKEGREKEMGNKSVFERESERESGVGGETVTGI